jgi:hypothetical protein
MKMAPSVRQERWLATGGGVRDLGTDSRRHRMSVFRPGYIDPTNGERKKSRV